MLQKINEKIRAIPLWAGIASGLVGLVFLVISLLLFIYPEEEATSEIGLEETTEQHVMETIIKDKATGDESAESASAEQNLYVDVKGAVNTPGVYQVTSDMRLMDAIELAGGFLISADQSQINLALKLTDQMVVYVPQIGEEVKEIKDEISLSGDETEEKTDTININTADVTQLQTLNGIGEKKAEKIIQYREENGSFQSTDELKKVSGIGDKTFEALKDSVVVDAP